jgi:hypothetical protein
MKKLLWCVRRTRLTCLSFVTLILVLPYAGEAGSPQKIFLWPNGVPLVSSDQDTTEPFIFVYPTPSATATGTAVVVCPGGGYLTLAMDHEGSKVAELHIYRQGGMDSV